MREIHNVKPSLLSKIIYLQDVKSTGIWEKEFLLTLHMEAKRGNERTYALSTHLRWINRSSLNIDLFCSIQQKSINILKLDEEPLESIVTLSGDLSIWMKINIQ